jgi:fumarate hydratase subunit alpha
MIKNDVREIQVSKITEVVERLCIEANQVLPQDVKDAIGRCRACEDGMLAQGILDDIVTNYEIAQQEKVPICQDTGMACVFVELGQDVHLVGGDYMESIHEGVRRGYEKGYLRKSVVADPIRRGNTGDNTPAMVDTQIVPGDQIRITVGPKGFGSENMSAIRMFKPSAGLQGIKDFILETVEKAGPNPCPPMVVGVGIGGTFDKVALIAKKALMRPLDSPNPDPYYAELEREMLEKINRLGIGPQGFGGRTTALGVNIETLPTHIAGMPCAVNISCHVTRHKTEVI